MTSTEKRAKILAMASSKVGAPVDIYLDLAREMAREGLIEMQEGYSRAGGNRKLRWFLKKAA